MFFQREDIGNNLHISLIEEQDIGEVLDVYNSNRNFLISHLGKNTVTSQWILNELENMRKIGFHSCKIVERDTRKLIGIADFRVDEEAYLSLLMIHNKFRGLGYGKMFLLEFEKYAKSLGSKGIRIDVVTDYDSSTLSFWLNNGFTKCSDVQLNWAGKALPAKIMKKSL